MVDKDSKRIAKQIDPDNTFLDECDEAVKGVQKFKEAVEGLTEEELKEINKLAIKALTVKKPT